MHHPVNRCEHQSGAIHSFLSSLVDSDDNNNDIIWILFYIFQDIPGFGSDCQQLCDCCFMSSLKPSFREAPVQRTLCTAMIASLAAS